TACPATGSAARSESAAADTLSGTRGEPVHCWTGSPRCLFGRARGTICSTGGLPPRIIDGLGCQGEPRSRTVPSRRGAPATATPRACAGWGLNHERLTYYHNDIQRRLTDAPGQVIRPVLS